MAPQRSNSASPSKAPLLGGLLLGTAIGAVVGFMAAPRSGAATRRKVKQQVQQSVQQSLETLTPLADDITHSYQTGMKRWSKQATHQWQGLVVRCKEAIAAGIEAGKQVQETDTRDTVAVAVYSSEDGPTEDYSPEDDPVDYPSEDDPPAPKPNSNEANEPSSPFNPLSPQPQGDS